ncbi:heavy metal translocating P-type ATPase [Idiomarina sp. HP20-50]|uniref:heavy metal translocating P-type ATPase n=1 Tax=Idiomarina sp. HP20-50 TaxID=3070813 RepID=UPI00294B1052|nr:heavy metal translocating P-type ATPase metal-binding domain-containing protein [Idiomarina sp. HP20-50]MDV6315100.1 heavy metal translocating P-type ATPase metal-binding domain-containing protein [Idiomarina sp. HP20-50]
MECFHCLQPVPKGINLTIQYKGSEKPVCCAGCQAVAQTIIDHNLHAYYEHRDTAQLQQPPALPNELKELALYDHPDLQKEFVRHEGDDTEVATLTVENITCGACGWLIERELMRLKGMQKGVVNVTSRRLQVTWSSSQLKLSDILKALAGIGYKALPFQPNEAEQQYTRQRKNYIRRLGVAGIATMQVMMIAFGLYFGVVSDLSPELQRFLWGISLVFATPVILYSAQPFYVGALRALQASRLNMDVPVSIALLGAYSASVYATITNTGEVYFESISMFTFFLLTGRFLELLAKERALKFATNRLTLLPRLATRETLDGAESIAIKQLNVGDIIRVKAGETIPADGYLLSSQAQVDESLLTGESKPRAKKVGDSIIAGSINQHSPIRIEVTATAQQTVLAGIVAMQDSALAIKPKAQQVIDKVAGYFIAAILTIAIITYFTWWWIQPDHALWVTLAVLVATCPCALSLAAPTALSGIVHRLNQKGILLKGTDVLESVKQLDKVFLDKTGTLTEGKFRLTDRSDSIDPETVNKLVSGLELFSEHPLSVPLSQLSASPAPFQNVNNEMGLGLQGDLHGKQYRVGSESYIKQWHPEFKGLSQHQVILADRERVLAQFRVEDQLREGTLATISWLRAQGYQPIILSGDSQSRVKSLADELGIADYHSALKPEEKLTIVTEQQAAGHTVWMVGDGINDSPVLAKADLSMTFSQASDLAQTAADVVLMSTSLDQVKTVIESALKTRKIMKQNFTWALVYNVSILPVAAMGLIAPWAAALGMSLSSLLVIGNSLRLYQK